MEDLKVGYVIIGLILLIAFIATLVNKIDD